MTSTADGSKLGTETRGGPGLSLLPRAAFPLSRSVAEAIEMHFCPRPARMRLEPTRWGRGGGCGRTPRARTPAHARCGGLGSARAPRKDGSRVGGGVDRAGPRRPQRGRRSYPPQRRWRQPRWGRWVRGAPRWGLAEPAGGALPGGPLACNPPAGHRPSGSRGRCKAPRAAGAHWKGMRSFRGDEGT